MSNEFNLRAPINNATSDPIQGYDADVYVLDQATGKYILAGQFASIQVLIRHSSEAYLTFGQRIPRYLDGEIGITWQLERGQLDTRILQQTFGFSDITRKTNVGRMPRFQITFLITAAGLNFQSRNSSSNSRYGVGELVLSFCKVEAFTLSATAGKAVVANRWEGLAEGITFINRPFNNSGSDFDKGTTHYTTALKNGSQRPLRPFSFSNIPPLL